MEEKERYEMNDNDCLVDNEQNTTICDFCELTLFPEIVINLLNQQDKRIKELIEENKKLKQSQKQLAISEMEALVKFCEKNTYYYEEEQFAKQINEYINEKIKELKGE